MNPFRRLLFAAVAAALTGTTAFADDPAKVLELSAKTQSLAPWTTPPTADADGLAKVVQTVEKSVVILGTPDGGHGTGFVISRKHRLVATNAHVADIHANSGGLSAAVNNSKARFKVDRVWYHPNVQRYIGKGGTEVVRSADPAVGPIYVCSPDVAVVRLGGTDDLPDELPLATWDELTGAFGKSVGMVGFPGSDGGWPKDGKAAAATYHNGVISRVTDFTLDGGEVIERRQFLQHTMQNFGGFSGSPMFLTSGKVVGLNNMARGAKDRDITVWLQHGVRIDCLWELLAHHNLDEQVPGVDATRVDLKRFDKPDRTEENLRKALDLVDKAGKLSKKDGILAWARAGEKLCDEAIQLTPNLPQAYRQRGMYRSHIWVSKEVSEDEQRRAREGMVSDKVRAAQLLPTNLAYVLTGIDGLTRKAGVEVDKKGLNELIGALDRIIQMEGNIPRSHAYATRGDANWYLKDYHAAKKDYRKAIELIDAGDNSTWKVRNYQGLANCYADEGNKEEADRYNKLADEILRK